MLHVLIGENARYDQLMGATKTTRAPWIVPKKARKGDRVALFFPGKGGFVALGKLMEDAPERPPYLAEIGQFSRFPESISLDQVTPGVPGWAWLRYPRKYTTLTSPRDEQLLDAFRHPRRLPSVRNAQVAEVLPTPSHSSKREPLVDKDAPSSKYGSGYVADRAKRDAIELRAMELAEKHYIEKGFAVENTAVKKLPYDFRCMQGSREVRVEVKGTSGEGTTVEVTRGEVQNARGTDWRTDLFIVSKIKVATVKGKPVASGGEVCPIENWQPAQEDLLAIRFRCKVRVPPRARRPRG